MTQIWNSFARLEKTIFLGSLAALLYFAGGFYGMRKTAEALPPVFEQAPPEKRIANNSQGAASILVHVSGAVKKPGVLRLAGNSRVQEAVKLAGGATEKADLNSLNLAQKLKDGEQVLVRERGEMVSSSNLAAVANWSTASSRKSSSAKLPSRPVNVNTASGAELETLPGIGPKTAAQIMTQRAGKPFRSLNDLDEVKGLGPKKLEKLKPYVLF